MANDHKRFYIDLSKEDSALLLKLTVHLTGKTAISHNRADVMRAGLRSLAKKEKVA